MKQTHKLTRLLASAILFAALASGVSPAQNTNNQNDQGDAMSRQMIRQTQQCVREAQRDFSRCRRHAHGNRRRLARCRRAFDERRSGCSG